MTHSATRAPRIVVIGAGMGGLAAGVDLARAGCAVTICEAADAPGGKMRALYPGGAAVDSGPTVFTMRWAFEGLFGDAGAALGDAVPLEPARVLARHGWRDGARLDLFADVAQSADAIGGFAGAAAALGFRTFCAEAKAIYDTLEGPFLKSSRPGPLELMRRVGRLSALLKLKPTTRMWGALGRHFTDPRLRQLFGRYATYCGSSPFLAPATLMLVAHVEQEGVWLVKGGMVRLAAAMADLARAQGAEIRLRTPVAAIETAGGRVAAVRLGSGERLAAEAVVFNGDVAALAAGKLGADVLRGAPAVPVAARSQSAITWSALAETEGFPLARHAVFFSDDYAAEFDAVFRRGRTPRQPTVYICAQDRDSAGARADGRAGPERLLILTNAPALGDRRDFDAEDLAQCEAETFDQLKQCGLTLRPSAMIPTTPTGFNALFPATGGALYGRANHGAWATFARPGGRSRIPGLYLAGGSAHPGPGAPMATLSGRQAAAAAIQDRASIVP